MTRESLAGGQRPHTAALNYRRNPHFSTSNKQWEKEKRFDSRDNSMN